jgi:hypothetical protein
MSGKPLLLSSDRTDQGFGRGKGCFVRARRHRHTPDYLTRKLTILLLTLTYYAVELLKASLNAVVAEERALDGPEDLTG